MTDILHKILLTKQQELHNQKLEVSQDSLVNIIHNQSKTKDFLASLTKSNRRGINVISEIKKASPSAGLIRPDFDPVAIARVYLHAGADAISILTDEPYFQGKLEYLSQVRSAVDTPLLRKDFIIDPYQIYQARAAGADAVLLIAEAFDQYQPLEDLFLLAADMDLAVLFEIHDLQSTAIVDRLLKISAPKQPHWLLGINNRNLKTMTVNLGHSINVAKKYLGIIPLVSESGIKTRQDVELLIDHGFNAVLIGETLMRQTDITAEFNQLFSPMP